MHITVEKSHPEFPAGLAAVPDAPDRLWLRGVIPARRPVVGIVGARAASGHGLARAHDLASELAARGALVVSGGALGIDAAAHVGALDAGAPTVVVLATPIEAPAPSRNVALFQEIVERGGGLVTPFAPGTPVKRWHYPRRNRVIAGLCDAVVVIEATPGSGSLYTAEAASQYGRILGACPGSPATEVLLAQGAALVETAADVLAAIAGSARRQTVVAPETGSDESRALAVLEPDRPCDVEAVARAAALDAPKAARALLGLELRGLALALPGGRYVRSALARLAPDHND